MNDAVPPAEAELVARAQAGDEAAFQALCERYEGLLRPRLAAWLKGPVQRKLSVADLLQEAYITAHERLSDFEDRGEGAFGAWLAQIAEFKARDAIRRYVAAEKRDVRREASRGARPETRMFLGSGPTPSQAAVGQEREAAVLRAMDGLPDDYRQVLHLVRGSGITLKEAAEVMGRSHEATKKLYGRAVSRLADLLQGNRKGQRNE